MKFNQHLNELQIESLIMVISGRRKKAPEDYGLHVKSCDQCAKRFLKEAKRIRRQCDKVLEMLPLLSNPESPITAEGRMMALRHLSLCGSCWAMYETFNAEDEKIFQGEKL